MRVTLKDRILFHFWKRMLKLGNRESYQVIQPKSLLVVNWIYQRVFNINGEAPISVHYTSLIQGFENITYGKGVEISFAVSGGCYFGITKGTTLTIGDDTIWAFNVCIQTANHDFIDRKKYIGKSVKIGKNCWIGNSVTILPGVELGDNVTVGANAVVTKSFPSNVVIAGSPAKIIRHIDANDQN